jgi:hypothetical protein
VHCGSKNTLSLSSLCDLLVDLDETDVKWVINNLASILPTQPSGVIQVIHISLIDFLTTKDHSKDFFVAEDLHNVSLAHACLQTLNQKLQKAFPIRESSNLNGELNTLSYASQFWFSHLMVAEELKDKLLELTNELFCSHLLEWLHLVGYLDALPSAILCLESFSNWKVCMTIKLIGMQQLTYLL